MLLLFVTGCVEFFAVQLAPERVPERSDTPESEAARQAFWQAFTENDLASIPQVRADLTAEYLAHPQDASLARLLGHLHFWTFVERDRLPWKTDASITDHVVISEHGFRRQTSEEASLGKLRQQNPSRPHCSHPTTTGCTLGGAAIDS